MIKGSRAPPIRRMALLAVQPEVCAVNVIFLMAGVTIRGGLGKNIVGVAGLAGCAGMFTGEWETQLCMIDRRIIPGAWGMAGAAVRSKLAKVGVILGVACCALLWG